MQVNPLFINYNCITRCMAPQRKKRCEIVFTYVESNVMELNVRLWRK